MIAFENDRAYEGNVADGAHQVGIVFRHIFEVPEV